MSDRAMKRACYVLRFLLADRYDLRKSYFRASGRVAIIPAGEKLRSLPEFRFLPEQFDESPGLGATVNVPLSVAREENIVCDSKDKSPDDILIQVGSQTTCVCEGCCGEIVGVVVVVGCGRVRIVKVEVGVSSADEV